MVMTIGQPVVGKNNQGVDAIGPVIDRQLDAGQQRNILLLRCLAQRFELLEIELVVIGDDAQLDTCFLQRVHIIAVVEVVIACVLELTICAGVQMEVRTNPLRPLCKDGSHHRPSS